MAATGDAIISLREVLVHMIEEYARHMGHADLLRERIDGRVASSRLPFHRCFVQGPLQVTLPGVCARNGRK